MAGSNGLFIFLGVKVYRSRVLRDLKLVHTVVTEDQISKEQNN